MNGRLNDSPVVTRVVCLHEELELARPLLDVRAGRINSLNSIESTWCLPRMGICIRFVDFNPEYGAASACVVGGKSYTGAVPNGGGWQSFSR